MSPSKCLFPVPGSLLEEVPAEKKNRTKPKGGHRGNTGVSLARSKHLRRLSSLITWRPGYVKGKKYYLHPREEDFLSL